MTHAVPAGWTADDIRPYVEYAIATFGPDRCMLGGDWRWSSNAKTGTRLLADFPVDGARPHSVTGD